METRTEGDSQLQGPLFSSSAHESPQIRILSVLTFILTKCIGEEGGAGHDSVRSRSCGQLRGTFEMRTIASGAA